MILDTLKNLFQGVYNARIEKRLQLALIRDIDQDFERITGATVNKNDSIKFGECTLFDVWGFVSERINKFNYTYNQLIGEIEAEDMAQYHQLKIISYNDYLSCRAYNPPQYLQSYFEENPELKAIIGHNLSNEPYQDYAKMIKDFYPKFGSFFFQEVSI